jgi:hypothetical protein
MEFFTGLENWFVDWMPNIGGSALCMFAMMVVTYAFIWAFIINARKLGVSEIKLPFGIYIQLDNLLDVANADMLINEGIHETGQQLEYHTRVRMRAVMERIFNRYLRQYPDYKEYIMRGKLTIADAIADNHIVYSMSNSRVVGYTQKKQEAIIDSVNEDLADKPEVIDILNNLVKDFIFLILPIQQRLCEDKIAIYQHGLRQFQLDGNKILCQTKINKNEKYLEAIYDLETNIDVHISHITTYNRKVTSEINGADLMKKNLENVNQVRDRLTESGIISDSSIVRKKE